MGWHIKSPGVFPAKFFSIIRLATDNPGTSYPLISGSYAECFVEAEKLRYFKFCVRKTQYPEIFLLVETFDVRSVILEDGMDHSLMIYARPTKLTEFARLNPILADEVFRECQ